MMPNSYLSAEEVLSHVQSNQRVFVQGSAATPIHLVNKLKEQKHRLTAVELVSITLHGVEFLPEEMGGHFFINSLFVSQGVRKMVNSDFGDYVPVFLSEIPGLFRKGILPLDIAIIQVSPPDKNGSIVSVLVEDGATLQLGIGNIPDAVHREFLDREFHLRFI